MLPLNGQLGVLDGCLELDHLSNEQPLEHLGKDNHALELVRNKNGKLAPES